ncbi:hypothetical protein [Neolewinella agarilytica]|uniref:hypothetical protein n=1 Tax=Neolewinella agarilytica TaxID=478744 RepID=UPI0015872C87|nr:hypothetical protein [Neolewinella agarilytica]
MLIVFWAQNAGARGKVKEQGEVAGGILIPGARLPSWFFDRLVVMAEAEKVN